MMKLSGKKKKKKLGPAICGQDTSSSVPIDLQKRKSRQVTFYILDFTNENCIFGLLSGFHGAEANHETLNLFKY